MKRSGWLQWRLDRLSGALERAALPPTRSFRTVASGASGSRAVYRRRGTQLISAARDGDDPALAALSAILTAKLAPALPAKRAFTVIGRRRPPQALGEDRQREVRSQRDFRFL